MIRKTFLTGALIATGVCIAGQASAFDGAPSFTQHHGNAATKFDWPLDLERAQAKPAEDDAEEKPQPFGGPLGKIIDRLQADGAVGECKTVGKSGGKMVTCASAVLAGDVEIIFALSKAYSEDAANDLCGGFGAIREGVGNHLGRIGAPRVLHCTMPAADVGRWWLAIGGKR